MKLLGNHAAYDIANEVAKWKHKIREIAMTAEFSEALKTLF
jgi:hypothetical protein